MNARKSYRKNALAISALLITVCLCSLFALILPAGRDSAYIADIYQDGKLIMSIPLQEDEDQSFTIIGENGCRNQVEIRSGSIGILWADCPDKLCVGQGFIKDSRLPITCLPNRLVIQLRPAPVPSEDAPEPDITTY